MSTPRSNRHQFRFFQVNIWSVRLANIRASMPAEDAPISARFAPLSTCKGENRADARRMISNRKMLLAWKKAGVITYAGYILGFPNDTVESIREDIEIIKKELALDVLEFFCLTPLPGSEDHQILHKRGVEMDADMNRYDAEHVVTAHPRMSRHEWQSVYRQAWDTYYTPEHLETLMRRAAAANTGLARMQSILLMFSSAVAIENVHPLQCGIFRLKFRKDRRANLQIEPVWVFYPKYLWEIVSKRTRLLQRWLLLRRITARVRKTSRSGVYTDLALTAVNDEAADMLELFTHTRSARTEVERIRKITRLTHSPDMVVDSFRR